MVLKFKLSRATLAVALFVFSSAEAGQVVNLQSKSPILKLDDSALSKNSPFFMMKQAVINQKPEECLAAARKIKAPGVIRPWVVRQELECINLKKALKAEDKAMLKSLLESVDKNPNWLIESPFAPSMQTVYIEGSLNFLELQMKSDRKIGWKVFDRLQSLQSMMTTEQKARLHRMAGEMAFVEQNLLLALNYFNRSLSEKESADLRKRVDSLKINLKLKDEPPAPGVESQVPAAPVAGGTAANKDEVVGVSEEEMTLYNRFYQAMQSQELLSAVQDGVMLIQKFPGSSRSLELTDKIQDIYGTMASRTEDKFRSLREQVIKEMVKVDGMRLSKWAQFAYMRGYYLDALNLSEKAYSKVKGQPDSTRVLVVAGRSALFVGEYKNAAEYFEILTKEHSGTKEAAEAHFRLGLLKYREKKDSEASAYFERLLALAAAKDFEYRALYWYWRAQQRMNAEKSKDLAMRLIQKYPVTYYALKAKKELNLPFYDNTPAPVIDARLVFSDREKEIWDRFNVLAQNGWWNEAKAELDLLPISLSNQDKIIRARLYRKIHRIDQSISIMSQVWDEDPSLIRTELLKMVFPKDYSAQIQKESQVQKMDPLLVHSLIRQESAFRFDALSTSNAMGLMQIIPPTGQELATDLKIKNFDAQQLFQPDLNIKMGTLYISRLVRSFGGNSSYALAAYNAGPTKVRRWMNFRPQIFDNEDDEIWIDELPWDETSFYVKAILRNLILYKSLFEEKSKE